MSTVHIIRLDQKTHISRNAYTRHLIQHNIYVWSHNSIQAHMLFSATYLLVQSIWYKIHWFHLILITHRRWKYDEICIYPIQCNRNACMKINPFLQKFVVIDILAEIYIDILSRVNNLNVTFIWLFSCSNINVSLIEFTMQMVPKLNWNFCQFLCNQTICKLKLRYSSKNVKTLIWFEDNI